ncbi:DUF1996 domain-containing protein [Streptomyces sp. DSM 44918]|uniref:DUF1996 domain-containing protein n=2 Tax=Streptomyces millisiae TaxID=3075542 RepID=A0ABU2LL09_9ACTN|nr:DUF1996 domain-containing protein [Streptomyces sp. DSM 44918]MDT0318269.1 DUF1996 domain-containing protein [Streptomyces sp. DSM 44918]
MALVTALVVGGGGAVVIAQQASAGWGRGGDGQSQGWSRGHQAAWRPGGTIQCPDVGQNMEELPDDARTDVGQLLADLDQQVADAYGQIPTNEAEVAEAEPADSRQVLDELESQREETIEGIVQATGVDGGQAERLRRMSPCQVMPPANPVDTAPPPADGGSGGGGGSVECPEVQVSDVPAAAQAEVDRELANLQRQIEEANARLVSSAGEGGPNFVDNAILGPLQGKRTAALDRIRIAIERQGGTAPAGLQDLAACEVGEGGNEPVDTPPDEGEAPGDGGGEEQAPPPVSGGPFPEDFVDITTVTPNVTPPPANNGAGSTGTFSVDCGTNEEGQFNSDNVIVAPGVSNGAHHLHDYIGNIGVDAFSTDESMAAADTTCTNGDQSTYYWPVLRVLDEDGDGTIDAAGGHNGDHNGGGAGEDAGQIGRDDVPPIDDELDNAHNSGRVLEPVEVSLTFQGNPTSPVVDMPRFLRIITGDAKTLTNGTANANASWSCTGFEDSVQLTDKYPLCPEGSDLVRTFDFQSCWDGVNADSANHRTHVAFAQADGSCQEGFQAIPQLVQRIVYDVPQGPVFAVDSFPEQLHNPSTDHGDFINVMNEQLMAEAVACINEGRECGP